MASFNETEASDRANRYCRDQGEASNEYNKNGNSGRKSGRKVASLAHPSPPPPAPSFARSEQIGATRIYILTKVARPVSNYQRGKWKWHGQATLPRSHEISLSTLPRASTDPPPATSRALLYPIFQRYKLILISVAVVQASSQAMG